MLPDGSRTSHFSTLTNEVYEDFSVRHLSDDLLPPMTQHQMGSCLRNLSWHTAGMASYVANSVVERSLKLVHEVQVPPDVHVLYQDWSSSYSRDPVYKKMWPELQKTKYVDDEQHGSYYLLHKGKIRHGGKVCVPVKILPPVLTAVHSYAHPGIDKTEQLFHRRFKVLGPVSTVSEISAVCSQHVHHCSVCQRARPQRGHQPDTRESSPFPDHIFHSISADFVKLPDNPVKRNGKTYDVVLCIVCRLNGYIVAIAYTEAGLTCADVAQLMVDRVFVHFGLPSAIYSDHDHLINAEFCKEFFRLSGVDEYKSPVYKPKSNGRAKNAVQLVVQSLRKLLEQKGSKDWVVLLPLAIWGLNDLPGRVTGFSRYRLVFGRHPVGFGDCPPILRHTHCKDTAEFFTQLTADREMVRDKLTAIHKKATEDFRRRHPLQVFQPGEKVWAKVNREGMDTKSTKLSRL